MNCSKLIPDDDLKPVADSIKDDIVKMVFAGSETGSQELLLSSLTTPKLRKQFRNPKVVWKNNNFRFPHVNKATGVVALYCNPKVRSLAGDERILDKMRQAYGEKDLIYSHGPPAPIVKPPNAGRSAPFVYRFQDTGEGLKYTAVLVVTESSGKSQAGLEELANFDLYYEILSTYFKFDNHCKNNDILHP